MHKPETDQNRARLNPPSGTEERHGLHLGPRCDPRLREALSIEEPLVLVGRQSPPSTKSVNYNVACDIYEAADALFETCDIDARHLLPTRQVLAQALAHSTNRITAKEHTTGKTFTITFAIIDLRREGHALILILSAGSGTKLAEDRTQPTVVHLADCIARYKPALLFAKRQDRFWRGDFLQLHAWVEIDSLRNAGATIFIGDGQTGLWAENNASRAQRFTQGSTDRGYVDTLRSSTTTRQVTLMGSDPVMGPGGVRFTLGGALPPGLTRLKTVTAEVRKPATRLFVDSPAALPPREDVADAYPLAHDASGHIIDQAENIRWFLRTAGKPGLTPEMLALELAARGYATDAIRKLRGPTWHHGLASAALAPNEQLRKHPLASRGGVALLRPILANLDFYETGELVRKVNGRPVTVHNCFPPDGAPWATGDDFQRVRQFAHQVGKKGRRAAHTFSRLPITFNGRPATLAIADTAARAWPLPSRAAFTVNDNRTVEQRKAEGRVRIEHAWLAQTLYTAFHDAQRVPAQAVDFEHFDPELAKAAAAAQRATEAHDQELDEGARLLRQAEELAPDGTYVLDAFSRKETWARRSASMQRLPQLERRRDIALADLSAAQDRARRRARGLEIAKLVDVLASLLNPADTTYREAWFTAIDRIDVNQRRITAAAQTGKQVDISVQVKISDAETTVHVQGHATFTVGAVADNEEVARTFAAGIRNGVPVPSRDARVQALTPLICRALAPGAPERGTTRFLNCTDPALLRFGCRVLYSDDATDDAEQAISDPEVVKTFARPDLLAARMRHLYHTSSGDLLWLKRRSRAVTNLLIHASQHDGTVTRAELKDDYALAIDQIPRVSPDEWSRPRQGVLQLRPCLTCGSRRRAIPRFIEPVGYICLDCRSDSDGIKWPAALYDRWIAFPELWVAAGHDLELTSEPRTALGTAHPNRPAGYGTGRPRPARLRALAALSEQEKSDLVAAYEQFASIKSLEATYGLPRKSVVALLQERGVYRPSPRR